ncbi:hypothetical protein SUGI_0286100 [Cryptomeria japonica]|nr:hypothetical protein SUGI_0286100 [Cryptomeria japonica]
MGVFRSLRLDYWHSSLHNGFKIGGTDFVKLKYLNKKSVPIWPSRHHYHYTRISVVKSNNDNGNRSNNWASIHGVPSVAPLLAALALVLQNMRGRVMFRGEQGPYILENTVKKWIARLQGCRDMVKEAELANGKFLQQGGIGMALMSTTLMAKQKISPVLEILWANPTFMSGLLAWAIAQMLKVVTTFVVERRWDLKMFVSSGGMPSSHSALCCALTASVAICHGVSGSLFPVCLGFSLIVMYDAIGVRRHAGMQAEVLNLIVEDLFKGHPISDRKLKELLEANTCAR